MTVSLAATGKMRKLRSLIGGFANGSYRSGCCPSPTVPPAGPLSRIIATAVAEALLDPLGNLRFSPARGRLAHPFPESSVERADMRESDVGGNLADPLVSEQQTLGTLDPHLLNEIGERDS